MRTSHAVTIGPRLVLAIGAFASVLLGGCETLQDLAAGTTKPSARVTGVRVEDLSLEAASLAFDVEVSNPYSVALPLVDVDYALASGGTSFLTGAAPLTGSIPAGGSKVVSLPARVAFYDLLDVLETVEAGSLVPYTADLGLGVDAPGVGPLRLPVRKEGEVPVPAVPDVELSSIEWGRLGLDEAEAVLALRVRNPNQFPLDLSRLDYGLSLAGRPVAETSVSRAVSFPAGGEQVLEIPMSFAPTRLGLAFLDVLRGEGAGYDLSGLMKFDSPFGPIDLPYEQTGRTAFRR